MRAATSPNPSEAALLLDVQGTALSADERKNLRSPGVAGVILFKRNFHDRQQLCELVREIRACCDHALICVDQEGGRVQRFQSGFTRLPAARRILEVAGGLEEACFQAGQLGWLMAHELLEVGLDFSFAPVCDIDFGRNEVIADRAFARNAEQTAALALAFWQGMRRAGMAGVAKHFPGHGAVSVDTHCAAALDSRASPSLRADMAPFCTLINHGIEAVMPAHVCYPAVDARPAGQSPIWLQDVLRRQLGFQGVIISDDLGMAGAGAAEAVHRAETALRAGCDLIMLCNQPQQQQQVLDWLQSQDLSAFPDRCSQTACMRLRPCSEAEPSTAELRELDAARSLAEGILAG